MFSSHAIDLSGPAGVGLPNDGEPREKKAKDHVKHLIRRCHVDEKSPPRPSSTKGSPGSRQEDPTPHKKKKAAVALDEENLLTKRGVGADSVAGVAQRGLHKSDERGG